MTELPSIAPIAAIYGEAVAGESLAVRNQLESLILFFNKSNFDIGELLHKVKSRSFYTAWGYNTFKEYTNTLKIKPRKAQYLTRIVEIMGQLGVPRESYEPLGIARLRAISRLDPYANWTNPETGGNVPVRDFILQFIEKGEELSLEELQQHVRTIKGEIGENDLVWLPLRIKRSALDQTVRPALDLAKKYIGSVGKDDEGVSMDASDGAAVEVIAVEYLNDPANHFLAEAA